MAIPSKKVARRTIRPHGLLTLRELSAFSPGLQALPDTETRHAQ